MSTMTQTDRPPPLSPSKDRMVIVIDDDSEPEHVAAQLLQESPRGSASSIHGLLNGTNEHKADPDPPRTPTTTAGEVPTSASVSPSAAPSQLHVTARDDVEDLHASQDLSQKAKHPHPKAQRAESPLQLPPKPPQQPTIRLEFFIDDPDDYEVDIITLAKASGQRLPTPPPAEKDSSDSEDDDEPPDPHPPGPPSLLPVLGPEMMVADMPAGPKRRKRRNRDYDLDDPFIDDNDLAIDERTHVAQTTLQGFYVSIGDVALVEEDGPNTPPAGNIASKRGPGRPPKRASGPLNATLVARTLLSHPLGGNRREEISTQAAIAASMELGANMPDGPEALGEDMEIGSGSGIKRKRDSTPPQDSMDPNKRRKVSKHQPFCDELQADLDNLQKAIAKHDFANKGKFPPDLKPLLLESAIKAITVGEYNDNFFNYLPKIFPYNRYTMFKLTKRLAYKDHIRLIHERQGQLLEELAKQVEEGMDQAKLEYERNVALWEERRSRKKLEGDGKLPNGMDGVEPTNPLPPPTQHTMDDHDKEGEGDDGEDDKDKPPATRYRLNEAMRGYLWALVQLSNEVCSLTNEKNHLEGSKELVSDQSQRKELYKKILQAFPDGWMNTGAISREVSMMKKKMESLTGPKPEENRPAAMATA
ncbi:hypothetical protein CPB86DRAFT_731598 [Serendipita vermifera]|nr:hypothetical protein CPB86DRAFT_731598 [Serendipita vermifera]